MIFDIGHDDLRRASCCAKAYTDDGTMSTSIRMETILFSEQTTAARRDYFASSNSGVVGQDVRDVGNVVEKFTTPPTRCRGNVPPRSFIVGVGPPFPSADFRVGLLASKALGIGTGTVQRVLMEQPRPFDVGLAEAALASQ